MRHVFHHSCNAYCGNLGTHFYEKPANNMDVKFNRPTKDRLYIKWLQWFAAHPGAKRADFIKDFYADKLAERIAFHKKTTPKIKRPRVVDNYNPSSYFAILLYHDYLDYDKNYRYTVTEKGLALLKQVED